MKKIVSLLSVVLLIVTLSACGSKTEGETSESSGGVTVKYSGTVTITNQAEITL